MFNIGWGEIVVIGVVALIAIGPKELPGVLRTLGQAMAKIRRMASEFQGQFNEAMREAEMADLKKDVEAATTGFSNFDPLADTKKDIERSFEDKPAISDATVTAPGEPTANALPEINIPLPEPVTSLTAADFSPPPAAEPAAPAEPPEKPRPKKRAPRKSSAEGAA